MRVDCACVSGYGAHPVEKSKTIKYKCTIGTEVAISADVVMTYLYNQKG